MSLKPLDFSKVPAETARIARAAFPKGNLYLKLRDELGTVFTDDLFVEFFSERGCPATSPARLALVTLFQFAEGLADRAAADAVRSRIDWKYALSLPLADPGFDATVLVEFRHRLLVHSDWRSKSKSAATVIYCWLPSGRKPLRRICVICLRCKPCEAFGCNSSAGRMALRVSATKTITRRAAR